MIPKRSLSPKQKAVFDVVRREVIWLFEVWQIYIRLFQTSEERLELLTESASTFFAIIQNVLFDELVITLSRLTDPHSTYGKDNASLSQLIKQIDTGIHGQLVDILERKVADLKNQCKWFKIWRNKKIGHVDLATALSLNSVPLPGITRKDVDRILENIKEIVSEFTIYFFDSQFMPLSLVVAPDVEKLMQILKRAKESKDI